MSDLQKSMVFYTALGFTNNTQFSDDGGKCMVWTEGIFVMLLTHQKFLTVATKPIADTKLNVASVFSSKIEGENIELDSYIKHKKFGIEFLPDYRKKIDDLYSAYTFAKTNVLNKANISHAHSLLSKNIVAKSQPGKLRTSNMYVTTPDGRIEYVAATPFEVEGEMEKLYNDIGLLLKQELSIQEVFFFASMLHLVFVKIHPWNDGNGRSGRLLEKWFLGQKLGDKAWFVPSERNYYEQHQTYYKNIRDLGVEYVELDYSKALPFLLMLPNSIING